MRGETPTMTTMMTIEEMKTESELFQTVYPDLIGEIDRIENTRGKLNDFQLMMAVSYAKNGLGVLNYERRQTINAIFESFAEIYRQEGRFAADQWARLNFGCGQELEDDDERRIVRARIDELSTVIRDKETELLKIYREYYLLQNYVGK